MDGELILGAVKVQSRSCVMPRAMLVMGTDATRSFLSTRCECRSFVVQGQATRFVLKPSQENDASLADISQLVEKVCQPGV